MSKQKRRAKRIDDDPNKVQERIEFLQALLGQRRYTHEIRSAYMEKFGNCHWRTIDNWVMKAKNDAVARSNRSKDQHRADIEMTLDELIRRTDMTPGDIIAAIDRKREIFGLDRPSERDEARKPANATINVQHVQNQTRNVLVSDLDRLPTDELARLVNELES